MAFADLLTGPASRRALAQRDIAAVYRMLRDAGLSQASIAHATGQKQSEVSEIISGRQVQSVVLLERIADGLGVPRGWMGLAYAPDSAAIVQDEPQTEDLSDENLLRHAATVLWGRPSTLPHVEGCTYFALRRFDRAAAALSVAINGAGHAASCTVSNLGLLAAAQLRCGQLHAGLATARRVVGLSKRLRSKSIRGSLAPLQEAAAARQDSACQDLAREVAILRSAA